MIKKTRHATTNYRALKPFFDAVNNAGGHAHFTAPGFMDLVIENLHTIDCNNLCWYSISHYGEQNGDLMADPDMILGVSHTGGVIVPRTFRNDYLGINQEVFITKNGKQLYSPRLLTDLDEFLWQWLKNIKEQGFTPELMEV